MTGRDGLTDDDLRAELLPDREAMSVLGGTALPGYDAALLPDTAAAEPAGTGAAGAADGWAGTDAAADATEGEQLSTGDRSETFTASDSAYAGPE